MDNQKIRVFVSHSTQDSQIVDRIIDHLKKDDFVVFSSHVIPKGREYRDNLKDQIAYTHSFVLILTQSAANSSWVNQEVGIALALQVPILVVRFPTAESQDSGFLSTLQDLEMDGDAMDTSKLSSSINAIVKSPLNNLLPHYAAFKSYEMRTEMLAKWASEIEVMGGAQHIRQYGELSTFSFPEHSQHELWKHWGNGHAADKQIEESKALKSHALHAGCSLILHPFTRTEPPDVAITAIRLELLIEFLKSIPKELQKSIRVKIKQESCSRNELLIGDFLFAESHIRQPGVGFVHTFCTRHGATVANRRAAFESLIGMGREPVWKGADALDGLEHILCQLR